MPVRSGGWTDDTFVNHNQRPHGEIMKEMGLRRALIAYLFLALFSHLSIAQEAGEHRPSRIIIHAAKLLEVKTGKTLADQAIVIEGDKIVSVGPMVQVQRSTSDRLIDLPNATVLPGLTDAHTHLTGDPAILDINHWESRSHARRLPVLAMRGSRWKLGSRRSATSALRVTATWHSGTPSTQGTFPAHECWSAGRLWELPAATVMRTCFRLNITLPRKA